MNISYYISSYESYVSSYTDFAHPHAFWLANVVRKAAAKALLRLNKFQPRSQANTFWIKRFWQVQYRFIQINTVKAWESENSTSNSPSLLGKGSSLPHCAKAVAACTMHHLSQTFLGQITGLPKWHRREGWVSWGLSSTKPFSHWCQYSETRPRNFF